MEEKIKKIKWKKGGERNWWALSCDLAVLCIISITTHVSKIPRKKPFCPSSPLNSFFSLFSTQHQLLHNQTPNSLILQIHSLSLSLSHRSQSVHFFWRPPQNPICIPFLTEKREWNIIEKEPKKGKKKWHLGTQMSHVRWRRRPT